MKQLILITLSMLLVGCANLQGDRKFPTAPDEIMAACPDLSLVNSTTDKLSAVVDVVTDNYAQYQYCQVKVNGWIKWYNTQKVIFDSVK